MQSKQAGKRIRLPAPQALRRCSRLLPGGTEFDPLAGYFERLARPSTWSLRVQVPVGALP